MWNCRFLSKEFIEIFNGDLLYNYYFSSYWIKKSYISIFGGKHDWFNTERVFIDGICDCLFHYFFSKKGDGTKSNSFKEIILFSLIGGFLLMILSASFEETGA